MHETLDWARIPYFLAVARTGSLRAAAERVGGTHATVDRNLRALEEGYGVRLFDRTTRGLSLTDAGEKLIPLAEEAETAMISARRRVQGLDQEASGKVRLSIPTTFHGIGIQDIIARFEQTYPDIELSIAVTNRFEDLNRAETDVSLRVAYQVDDDVVGRKIIQYAAGIFASREYVEKHWENAGPQGEGLQWIGWGDTGGLPEWVKNSPFPKARVRYSVGSPTLIGHLVGAGMGMSYLPWFVSDWIGDLVPMPGTDPFLDRSLWLLLHSDLRRTNRVRLLVDHLARELTALRPKFLGPLA
ncbi:MAG: LysR family transcriptional regulator [Paracoccaceae bacterium]